MKLSIIKSLAFAAFIGVTATSCSDFLNKPTEDSYNQDNYYATDAQCLSGTAYLYNSPWYDFQRGFIKVGEVLSGNYFWGSSPYLTFTVNGTDEDLINMSYSLWAVNAHCNTVYNNIKASSVSQSTKDACMGECLLLKGLAYFYLVRSFGEIPIVHDNTASLNAHDYNTYSKVQLDDVYEYITLTLEEAIKLLPEKNSDGRVDKYSAEGLLAKVYLTRAGVSGTLNAEHLAKARELANDVINNSTWKMEENYEDIFLLKNRYTREGLIAWRWTADGEHWTRQNSLQSDLAMNGIDDWGATWGGWNGMSVDLQKAFGVDLINKTPDSWINSTDTRLHATMMLPGFKYDQFWSDKGGMDYIKFIYENSASQALESATGANTVKHIYGDTADHIAGAGCSDGRMASSVPTFLLRMSDLYLIVAESYLQGPGSSTTDANACAAFDAVHQRAIKNAPQTTVLDWETLWKERRLEFAMEGDRWYDFVRVSYYNPDYCVNQLVAQQRNQYWNLSGLYENYYKTGAWNPSGNNAMYDNATAAPSVISMMKVNAQSGKKYFFLPFPTEDVTFNPNLASDKDGEHVDIRKTYSY